MSIDRLRSFYRERRLLIFVGAGISMSVEPRDQSKHPSWSQLVDEAAAQLSFTMPELLRARATDLQILEYYKIKKGNIASLMTWLATQMRPTDDALRANQVLQALAKFDSSLVIYTTNYDDFIERALTLHGRKPSVIAREQDVTTKPSDIKIVKFHGDWGHPDDVVLTESDYYRRFSFKAPLDRRFAADLLNCTVLFLGYSFRDANVAYLFSTLENRQVTSYITVANPSAFEYELFRKRKMEVVPIDRARRTEDVANILEEILK